MLSPASLAFAQKPSPIEIDELPEPPERIRRLIDSGRVTFEWGERSESSENRPGGKEPGGRLAAETHYRIAYNYNSRSRWTEDVAKRRVKITVRYLAIDWDPEHRIWFRKKPETDGFWSNKLVLHEFDHVQISNDPRIRREFERRLRDKKVLIRSIEEDDVVNRRFVDRVVDEHVTDLFEEVSELVSIRYKELDRITKHGREPIPIESTLAEFLAADSEEDTE